MTFPALGSSPSSFRLPTSREPARSGWRPRDHATLPEPGGRDRSDGGDAQTRARWQTYYSMLVAITLAEHPDRSDSDLLPALLPALHSACCWADPEAVCRWLAQEHAVTLRPAEVRRALRHPDGGWHVLWRLHLRAAVLRLVSAHRLRRSGELLDGDGSVLDRLRDAEAHLCLGDHDQSRASLEDLRLARKTLQQRWFGLEPDTRRAALEYLGPVLAQVDEDFLCAISPPHIPILR